jgi:hypothetical protein
MTVNFYFIELAGKSKTFHLLHENFLDEDMPEIIQLVREHEADQEGKIAPIIPSGVRIEVEQYGNMSELEVRWLFQDHPDVLRMMGLFPYKEELDHIKREDKVMYILDLWTKRNAYLYTFIHENLDQMIQDQFTELKLKERTKRPSVTCRYDSSWKLLYKDFHIMSETECMDLFASYLKQTGLRLVK